MAREERPETVRDGVEEVRHVEHLLRHTLDVVRQHRILHRGVQPLGEKVAQQPLIRLLQQDVLVQLAGNPAEHRPQALNGMEFLSAWCAAAI